MRHFNLTEEEVNRIELDVKNRQMRLWLVTDQQPSEWFRYAKSSVFGHLVTAVLKMAVNHNNGGNTNKW